MTHDLRISTMSSKDYWTKRVKLLIALRDDAAILKIWATKNDSDDGKVLGGR